jgi:hypothetical protein
VIGEPEMEGAEGFDAPPDIVGDADRRPLLGRFSRRPWAWAACAAVLTSAVWAGTLQATGYGRTHPPDLHGYRIPDTLCASVNLEPLVDSLGAGPAGMGMPAIVTRSSVLDHITCQLSAVRTTLEGWMTTYTVTVEVDLHKKTDPAAEFDAASRARALNPPPGDDRILAYLDDEGTTTHPRGIGDRADLTTAKYKQTLAVRHGGAVLSITLTGATAWDTTRGPAPAGADGAPELSPVADTSEHAEDLVPAMRRLMAVLSRPPSDFGT